MAHLEEEIAWHKRQIAGFAEMISAAKAERGGAIELAALEETTANLEEQLRLLEAALAARGR